MNKSKKKNMHLPVMFILLSVLLAISSCGGGGGGSDGGGGASTTLSSTTTTTTPIVNPADLDGDGVPNAEDSFPNDPARFASFGAPATLDAAIAGLSGAPLAINGSGRIVGHAQLAAGAAHQAVYWTAATPGLATPLPERPGAVAGDETGASGVNDTGIIIGNSNRKQGVVLTIPVFWSGLAAVPSDLPRLGGAGTSGNAFGIGNPVGGISKVVGEAQNDLLQTLPVTWAVDGAGNVVSGPVQLPNSLGGTYGSARSVNDAGLMVGEVKDGAGKLHAVLWRPAAGGGTEMVDLGLPQDISSSAASINAAGLIVGTAEPVAGEIHGILWTVTDAGVTRKDLGPGTSATAFLGPNRILGSKTAGGVTGAVVWDIRSTANPPDSDEVIPGAGLALAANAAGLVVGVSGNLTAGSGFVVTQN